jgi:predicted metal-dependent hydrolase
MTARDGLVVVVPHGFDAAKIPEILERKRRWIERAAARAGARRTGSAAGAGQFMPREIELPCLGATWTVEYASVRAGATDEKGTGIRTLVRERPGRRLVVHGDEEDGAACRAALRRWLVRRARKTLVPRLAVLAYENGFTLGPVSVRMQRTRWASCSRRGAVSLNAKLLFLSPELVDYVLLHELCHTVRPDHSPAFWSLLSEYDPGCRGKRRELRNAQAVIPAWFDEGRP